jgi:WD40 repeat protein
MEHIVPQNIEEASKRWIAEGLAYKNNLNDWLDQIYIHNKQPEMPCPEETRKDMAEYVLEKLAEYNAAGKQEEFRALFPPDHDPFDWDKLHPACISQVTILDDGRIIATINQWYQNRFIYQIENNTFKHIENIILFGKSFDKKYFAKVYADRIDITEGWDGNIISTHFPPLNYGLDFKKSYPNLTYKLKDMDFASLQIQSICVSPDGLKVYVGCALGIFEINQNESFFFDTENYRAIDSENYNFDEAFEFKLQYPHIDISPDGQYVVAGSQNSAHLVYCQTEAGWDVCTTVEPRSSYPNFAKYNYTIQDDGKKNGGRQVLLCSCHFGRSASIALPLNNINPGLKLSGYNADKELNYIEDRKWIFSAGLYPWGYGLGANDGYIWFRDFVGFQFGYLHVGGTVMDIDISSDRKKMAVASFSGQIIIYDCTERYDWAHGKNIFRGKHFKNESEVRKDPFGITNSSFKDEKRYLLLYGYDPLVW